MPTSSACPEQYAEGGITRLAEIIDQRTKQPGAGLYLLTTHAGEPIVGNVSALPPGVLDKTGVVAVTYQVKGVETTCAGPRVRSVGRLSSPGGA